MKKPAYYLSFNSSADYNAARAAKTQGDLSFYQDYVFVQFPEADQQAAAKTVNHDYNPEGLYTKVGGGRADAMWPSLNTQGFYRWKLTITEAEAQQLVPYLVRKVSDIQAKAMAVRTERRTALKEIRKYEKKTGVAKADSLLNYVTY